MSQAILERRLRPIYDALDNLNTKKALQEADKVLKKHPDTAAARVLKAFCFIRNEKLSEAIEILDSIDVPGAKHDANTILALVSCYKEAVIPERITRLYERVCEVEPNEANYTQLFMSHVRTREFKKQQLIGMKLFKEFEHTPYYYWGVMAVIMQAIENEQLGKKMLYPLAEKMFDTQIKKTGYTKGSGAELELEILILEGLEKYENVIELLKKPLDNRTPVIFINQKRADCYVKLEKFEDLRILSEKMLEEFSDDWIMWKHRIEATIGLIKQGNDHKKNLLGTSRLEIIKKFNDFENKTIDLSVLGKPEDLIFDFIQKFYTRPTCFNDVQIYFPILSSSSKSSLIKSLDGWIKEISENDEEEGKETKVWAIIVYERIRRVFGEWEKLSKLEQRQLLQQFIAQIIQPSISELAQGALSNLASSGLWDSWRKEDNIEQFYEMILLLEYVAQHNESDPVCKLELIRAYAHMGNTVRVTALTKSLDIKSVQNDTLGYLSFPIFEVAGRFNLAIIVNTQLSVIYDQAEKEITESNIAAYKNGKFEQVPRLYALSERMSKSSQAVGCDVLNRYLSSLFVLDDLDGIITTCYGDEEPINWSEYVDNRDLNVIPTTENENYQTILDDMKSRTFKEYIDVIRLRHSICRAVSSVGRITRSDVPKEQSRKQLIDEIDAFSKHLEQCQKDYQSFDVASRLPQSPAPLFFAQWIHSACFKSIQRFFEASKKIVEQLDAGNQIENIESLLGSEKDLEIELNVLIDSIPSPDRKPSSTYFWLREPICASSRILQTLAITKIQLRIISRLFGSEKKVEQVPTKSKKNVQIPVKTNPNIEFINKLLEQIKKSANLLSEKLGKLIGAAGEEDLLPNKVAEDLGTTRLVLETVRPTVDSRIRRSYVMALEDQQTTIQSRF
ncbi:unnamed protein product [Caenorhabditis angaria]|uniref:N-terminal acetyltransferase B complex subunit MDM20 homolog n=1 Tax=Caenorhabditis angaria TaxID=860376 RepID=A0A9P1IIL0_9PELO|nr:unnamed protein product [Caenorhabditis angaria]